MQNKLPFTEEELEACLKVLRKIARTPDLANDETELKTLVAKIYKKAKKEKKNRQRQQLRQEDQHKINQSFIFQSNDEQNASRLDEAFFQEKSLGKLNKSKNCYICKQAYQDLHYFYHELCPDCAEFNLQKRHQSADLNGRRAVLTGGRKKIGLQIGLKLLRAGAELIVSTRFPENARLAYQKEDDFAEWQNRLHISGLDLRNIRAVETFTNQLYEQFDAMDIIVNNAAQTVKRPLTFYQHLLEKEQQNFLIEGQNQSQKLALLDQHFPPGSFDKDFQQVDLRPDNSWITKLEGVSTLELLEVQLVNSIAPFLLNSRLKKLLEQSAFERKFIVNVSAVEGQFERNYKSPFHPHTNMAKAALNMMTRTSAEDYAQSGIYMTSVDTGWITDENPHPKKVRLRENGFVPPLDLIDGAARVCAPIFEGVSNPDPPELGVFIKDYKITRW